MPWRASRSITGRAKRLSSFGLETPQPDCLDSLPHENGMNELEVPIANDRTHRGRKREYTRELERSKVLGDE
jgi:hypothetical protein